MTVVCSLRFQCISVNAFLRMTFITMLAKDYLIAKKEKIQSVSNLTHFVTPTSHAYTFHTQRLKMFRNTLKILRQMLQDFEKVSDHFGRLFIKINLQIN